MSKTETTPTKIQIIRDALADFRGVVVNLENRLGRETPACAEALSNIRNAELALTELQNELVRLV